MQIGLLLISLFLVNGAAQSNQSAPPLKSDGFVSCSLFYDEVPPATPFGFSRAALLSLSYARDAGTASLISEISSKSDNPDGYWAGQMKLLKQTKNYYTCAKRAISPFASSKDVNPRIVKSATSLFNIYQSQIALNEYMLLAIKKMDSVSVMEFADQISTIAVQRSEYDAALWKSASIGFDLLLDTSESTPPVYKLSIRQYERKGLSMYLLLLFPEFNNDAQYSPLWSEAVKSAYIIVPYMRLKARDELSATVAPKSAKNAASCM